MSLARREDANIMVLMLPRGRDSTRRLPTLDGWRAIAIGMVVIDHVLLSHQTSQEPWASLSKFRWSTGVDVFFAISGLLITSRLLDYWNRTGSVGLSSFYIRRAFRILPPALCFLSAIGLLHLFGSRLEAVSCLTFWSNYLPSEYRSKYAEHFWSLAVEEQFYILWPVALALAGRLRAPRMLFWAIVAVNVWRTAVVAESSHAISMFRTDLRIDGLLWGCLAAFVLERRPRLNVVPLAVCVVAAPWLFLSRIGMPVAPVLVTAAVLVTTQHPRWPVSRALEWAPLVWIGKRSYSIYLWQQLILLYGTLPLPLGWSIAVRLLGLVVCAEASYRFIERPLQELGYRIARARGPAASVSGGREPEFVARS